MRSISTSIVLIGVIFVCAGFGLVSSLHQVIALRHPESEHQSSPATNIPRPTASEPSTGRARYSAKPGDVVVHFDRNHEIQTLRYVLQNGQLANLYHRQPATGQLPVQIQPPNELHRRDDGSVPIPSVSPSMARSPAEQPPGKTTGSTPGSNVPPSVVQPEPPLGMPSLSAANNPSAQSQYQQPPQVHQVQIDPAQSITIFDSSQNGVSQLVGNHMTVPLQGNSYNNPNDKFDDKFDVLATIAADALHTGAVIGEAKLHKAGALLTKLKHKLSQKVRELPAIIDQKLRVKSSPGQVYFDRPNGRVIVINDDEAQKSGLPLNTGQNLSPLESIYRRPPAQATLSKQRLESSP